MALKRISKEVLARAGGVDGGSGAEAELQRREGKPDRERPGCEPRWPGVIRLSREEQSGR